MSVCLDFKFVSNLFVRKCLNKCTSHLFHLFGVAVKLNKSHKLCCAHLWHCSLICLVLIISPICLNCKDLLPICILYYCVFSEFYMLDLLLHFSPAFSLQWPCRCVLLLLLLLCSLSYLSVCCHSLFILRSIMFSAFPNLFNLSLYNMIIVSLVLNLSHLL